MLLGEEEEEEDLFVFSIMILELFKDLFKANPTLQTAEEEEGRRIQRVR